MSRVKFGKQVQLRHKVAAGPPVHPLNLESLVAVSVPPQAVVVVAVVAVVVVVVVVVIVAVVVVVAVVVIVAVMVHTIIIYAMKYIASVRAFSITSSHYCVYSLN